MDVALVSTSPIDRPLAGDRLQTNASGGGFAATIAAEIGDQTSTLERAEELIGTRIRAPEGGCGCDALVGTAMQAPAPSAVAEPVQARPVMREPVAAISQPRDVSPGRILVLDQPSELGDHLHQAILRNATEMIATNRNGLVEVLSIPWDQVR